MRRIILKSKKRISITLAIVFGMIAIISGIVHPVRAAEEDMTYEMYKANYYIDYSPYEYYMSDEFTLPYRTQVEKNRESATYNALLIAWQLATFEITDVNEYSRRKVGYYESFLYDILYTGYEATNVSKTLSNSVKSIEASTLKKISSFVGADLKEYRDANIEDFTVEDREAFLEIFDSCEELSNAVKGIGDLTQILDYASTVEDVIYKLAKIEVISRLSVENAEVLEKIAANTDDIAMQLACEEMAAICRGTITPEQMSVILAGDATIKELTDYALETVWSEVTEKMNVYGLAVSAGQAAGKWVGGLFLSGDKEVETFYEMCALYDFENELREVVKSYEKAYTSNKTEENAKRYNASFEMLLQTMQLACDISIEYSGITYDDEGAPIGLFISYVTGNHEKYEKFKETLTNIKEQIIWLQDFANKDVYALYCDEYCADAVEVLDMQPEPNDATVAEMKTTLDDLQQNVFSSSDVHITSDYTLTEDMETYCDLYIEGGTVNLNGHTLTVQGDVLHSGGMLYVNGGEMDVTGDYYIAGSKEIGHDGEVDVTQTSNSKDAYLEMVRDADVVRVGGDFLTYSYENHSDYLKAGTLYVGGNFTEKYGSASSNFNATGTHKVVFNGTDTQKIIFERTNSGFANVEFKNPNIEFASSIRGFELGQDLNLTISTDEFGINGTWKLNGHSLGNGAINTGDQFTFTKGIWDFGGSTVQIKNDLLQTGGTIYLNGGKLNVPGDYYIAGSRSIGDDGNEVVTQTSNSKDAYLEMVKDADEVRVGGDFLTYSYENHSDYLKAGTLYVGGNFTEKYGSASSNFNATGTHKVVFNGTDTQKIIFERTNSGFANVEFKNPNIEIASAIRGFELGQDINLTISADEFGIDGTWKLKGHSLGSGAINTGDQFTFTEGIWDFGGSTVQIKNNLLQTGGTIYLNGGKLNVPGDYYIAGSRSIGDDGEEDVTQTSSSKDAYLEMVKDADEVRVGGDFLTYSYENHSDYLTAGTMYIGGDFTQKSGSSYNFAASGTHTVVLNSESKQNVVFESDSSHFNNLKLTKDRNNYTFNPENCWNKLISDQISEEPVVTGVRITPNSLQLLAGEKQQLTAVVEGTNHPSQEVTWILSGNNSAQTTVDSNGVLSIARDETAATVIVTAQSVEDNKKTASLTVIIRQPEEDDTGTTEDDPSKPSDDVEQPVSPDDTEQPAPSDDTEQPEENNPSVKPGETIEDNKDSQESVKPGESDSSDLPASGTTITDEETNADYQVVEQGKTVVYKKVLNVNVVNVTIPSVVNINGITYNVTNIANNAFSKCKKIKKIIISNNITVIGNGAFNKCTSLKRIVIPAKVTSIGKNAFSGCKNLKNIIIKSKKLKKIGKNAFKGINKTAKIKVPKNKLKAYKKLFKKAKLAKSIKVTK